MKTIVKLAHFTGGLISALMPFRFSVLAFIIFLTYEIIEYIRIRDTLYLEFRQYTTGFFLGLALRLILMVV